MVRVSLSNNLDPRQRTSNGQGITMDDLDAELLEAFLEESEAEVSCKPLFL